MSSRALILASVFLPALLSPAWAQDAPMATAPIPPAVKTTPEPPIHVAPKPAAPPAAAREQAVPMPPPTPPAAAMHAPPPPAVKSSKSPVKSAEKPHIRVRQAEQKKRNPLPPSRTEKTAAKAEKADKKAEKKIERNIAASARAAARQHWVVREQRRWGPPPPPFDPWYERYERGPMAYSPYGGGMPAPPPMPWDD